MSENDVQAEDQQQAQPEGQELVAEDLIEEVSIDGMCGVY
jgi:mycofactocin precursor